MNKEKRKALLIGIPLGLLCSIVFHSYVIFVADQEGFVWIWLGKGCYFTYFWVLPWITFVTAIITIFSIVAITKPSFAGGGEVPDNPTSAKIPELNDIDQESELYQAIYETIDKHHNEDTPASKVVMTNNLYKLFNDTFTNNHNKLQ